MGSSGGGITPIAMLTMPSITPLTAQFDSVTEQKKQAKQASDQQNEMMDAANKQRADGRRESLNQASQAALRARRRVMGRDPSLQQPTLLTGPVQGPQMSGTLGASSKTLLGA